jgi:hypothetical protein
VPPRWRRIIAEAVTIRRGSERSLYASREERISDLLEFLPFLIGRCNQLATIARPGRGRVV